MTYTRTLHRALAIVLPVAIGVASGPAVAQEDAAQGRFWYELKMEEDTYSMDLEIVDGVVLPDDLIGGERVKVMLVGEPLDRETFLKEFADSGHLMFAAMRLKIEERVVFDVCRYEDDSEDEICGIHINGPGLSSSNSGFGAYGHFTESVSFEGDRATAELKTPEPEVEGDLSYGFDLSFDLPVTRSAGE